MIPLRYLPVILVAVAEVVAVALTSHFSFPKPICAPGVGVQQAVASESAGAAVPQAVAGVVSAEIAAPSTGPKNKQEMGEKNVS